ncbi:MAG: RMD1 family protein, partial [Gammaproteobacteria bacterium]
MRCVARCFANSFNLNALTDYLKNQKYVTDLYRDVLQVSFPGEDKEIFCFAHGSFVMWGFTSHEETAFTKKIERFGSQLIDKPEVRYFIYRYSGKTRLYSHKRFQVEVIALATTDAELKLAISYGLAQSIKLEFYEETVKRIIRENTPLFELLAKTGKVLLNRQQITMRMGEIFLARSSVNLNSEYLDVPEYFWEHPNLENDYLISAHFLDIQQRVSTLN